MKVSELIKKLQKMHQDAEVAVDNDRMFIDGIYKADEIEQYDENLVIIGTSNTYRLGDDNKWRK
jgi:hypothetical protein